MEFSILEIQAAEEERRIIAEMRAMNLPARWDETRTQRLERCHKRTVDGFIHFATTYFPQWFTFAFSAWHRQLIAALLSEDRTIWWFCTFGEFGKTRILRVFKIWCACHGVWHHYSKSSRTLDLVKKDFRWTRLILEYNPLVVSDYPDILDKHWNSDTSFRIKPHEWNPEGTVFVANSLPPNAVTPRGELGEQRFDFAECDDGEDYSGSMNPDLTLEKIDVIERDFHRSLAEQSAFVGIANASRPTCIGMVMHDMPKAEREAHHPAWHIVIVPFWNEQENSPNWPERYKFRSEEEARLSFNVSTSVWKAEWQQKPTPPEGVRFLLKNWRTYDKEPADCIGIAFNDPALGETSYKNGVVLLYSPSTRFFYCPEAFCRRCDFEEYFQWNYAVQERWGSRLLWIGWEADFHQAEFLKFRNDYASTRKLPALNIKPVMVKGHGKKTFRIEQLENPYAIGQILFSRSFLSTRDGIEAQSQLIGYEGKENSRMPVHFPDCLSTAYRELWPVAFRMSSKDSGGIISGGRRHSAERI